MKMLKGTMVLALVAGTTASAMAGIGSIQNPSSAALQNPVLRGIPNFTGTGFEASEGWALGAANQQGWQLGASDAGYNVAATNKNGSVNSVQMSKNALAAQGNTQLLFSPLNNNNTLTQVCFDFKMDDAEGANYAIIAQAPSQALLTWRVEFDYGGNIFVLSQNDLGQTVFVNTGVPWNGNVWETFRVDVNASLGTIEYRRNGSLFFTGALLGGTINEQVVLLHDNFQDFPGNTSISGGPIAAYFDNVELKVPAPGALALLGLGGLIAGRRRRA